MTKLFGSSVLLEVDEDDGDAWVRLLTPVMTLSQADQLEKDLAELFQWIKSKGVDKS